MSHYALGMVCNLKIVGDYTDIVESFSELCNYEDDVDHTWTKPGVRKDSTCENKTQGMVYIRISQGMVLIKEHMGFNLLMSMFRLEIWRNVVTGQLVSLWKSFS